MFRIRGRLVGRAPRSHRPDAAKWHGQAISAAPGGGRRCARKLKGERRKENGRAGTTVGWIGGHDDFVWLKGLSVNSEPLNAARES